MRYRQLTSVVLAFSAATVAFAQEQATKDREATRPAQRQERTALRVSPDGSEATTGFDGPIAACLILGNREEVALAQFAQQRAQSPEVKEFALQMIKDHQQAISQLEKFAPQNVSLELDGQATTDRTRPERAAQNAESQTERTNRDATVRTGEGNADMQHQMLAMQKDIAQRCLALTQRELGEWEGAKFDQAYIGQQTGAHIGMLAKLAGSEQYATSELQSVLAQQQQSVEQHLQHAKQIMRQLEERPETARRQTAPQQ
jgi:predicted outer membrane protein